MATLEINVDIDEVVTDTAVEATNSYIEYNVDISGMVDDLVTEAVGEVDVTSIAIDALEDRADEAIKEAASQLFSNAGFLKLLVASVVKELKTGETA